MNDPDPEGCIHDEDVMCTGPPNIPNFLISTGSSCCCAVVCCCGGRWIHTVCNFVSYGDFCLWQFDIFPGFKCILSPEIVGQNDRITPNDNMYECDLFKFLFIPSHWDYAQSSWFPSTDPLRQSLARAVCNVMMLWAVWQGPGHSLSWPQMWGVSSLAGKSYQARGA